MWKKSGNLLKVLAFVKKKFFFSRVIRLYLLISLFFGIILKWLEILSKKNCCIKTLKRCSFVILGRFVLKLAKHSVCQGSSIYLLILYTIYFFLSQGKFLLQGSLLLKCFPINFWDLNKTKEVWLYLRRSSTAPNRVENKERKLVLIFLVSKIF